MTGTTIGLDVGGTFTDGVVVDGDEVRIAKVPSQPQDIGAAVLECVHALSGALAEIERFVHGTTIATNALIEKSGPRIAHITTAGYRDVLYIRRGDSKPYDLAWRPPVPIVRRRDIYEITERLAWDGSVDRPFDADSARRVATIIAEKGYPAVSVAFLHSYANPAHEERMKEILEATCPDAAVCISSEVLPQYREFERSSTTAANAYLMPLVKRYLDDLEADMSAEGFTRELLVMQSSGGITTGADAQARPARTVRSGPAGGAIAAANVAEQVGVSDAVFIDMGGTSTEVAVLHDGDVRWTPELEFAWGVPIRFPSVDIHSIGAGGGSIAWIEADQFLKVGPQSAGAIPGPACYGRGGEAPTTTDAQVLLGRLNPEALLGGAMPIKHDLAERAIDQRIGAPLGKHVRAAAKGIIEVTTNNTVQAIRLTTVKRGLDPRDSCLIAMGGSGPLYAVDVASRLGMTKIVVPLYSGIASALGMVLADFKYDTTSTLLVTEAELELGRLEQAFVPLRAELTDRLDAAGIPEAGRQIEAMLDVRYEGQGFELTVPIAEGPAREGAGDEAPRFTQEALAAARDEFHRAHEREFGWHHDDWPIEIVLARMSATGKIGGKVDPAVLLRQVAPLDGEASHSNARTTERECHFLELEEPATVPIVARGNLTESDRVEGPAIIEQVDTTTLIPPGWHATVDEYSSLIIEASR